MIRWYRFQRTSPGPTWVQSSRLQHISEDGQLIWTSNIWRRSLWRWLVELASLVVTLALMAGAILALCV